MNDQRIQRLSNALGGLTDYQLALIEEIVEQFNAPYIWIELLKDSDLINECILRDFGDTLRLHHIFSREPFTKDKFEYALESIVNQCGGVAELATRGNPGHDITLNGQRFSLKTQADRSIREKKLHISKFMELGKGEWTDQVSDLEGLRAQFFAHMESYDRMLSLRCLSTQPNRLYYELVEIPKLLLLEAANGRLRMMHESKQHPKPGYCDVMDDQDNMKFQLYFDGGTERKLQIRNLLKKLCIVHATWVFATPTDD